MLALSIKQPWADGLVGGHKSIEIRGWKPPASAIGQLMAIHASKAPDRQVPLRIARLLLDGAYRPARERCGGIIGIARLVCVTRYMVAADFARDQPQHLNPPEWFLRGLYGWVWQAPARFERLIPCRGQLGIFDLPPEIAAQIEAST